MELDARRDLLAIYKAGVAAVDPVRAIACHVKLDGNNLRIGSRLYDLQTVKRIFVVGAGKASAQMALALEGILGARITDGFINVKYGHGATLSHVRVREANHPVPDQAGVDGAMEIAKIADRSQVDDLLICLISGGGSALLPLPANSISLEDKQCITQELLNCGAAIGEMNTLRKHLSGLKGGQLARIAYPAQTATLILSDVIGDPIETIASGPTAPDTSTFQDAAQILEKHGLAEKIPESVKTFLREGCSAIRPETPKEGDAIFENVHHVIIANNDMAVSACESKARELGYNPLVLSTTLDGEAREVARVYAALGREILAHQRPVAAPACIIAGGETTVTLTGNGVGGRNQEFALSAAIAFSGVEHLTLLAAGTDGTDGPTDATGAFVDGNTCARAHEMRLDPAMALANNDSYTLFAKLADLLKIGPTGTNVMDLYLMLVGMPERS